MLNKKWVGACNKDIELGPEAGWGVREPLGGGRERRQ